MGTNSGAHVCVAAPSDGAAAAGALLKPLGPGGCSCAGEQYCRTGATRYGGKDKEYCKQKAVEVGASYIEAGSDGCWVHTSKATGTNHYGGVTCYEVLAAGSTAVTPNPPPAPGPPAPAPPASTPSQGGGGGGGGQTTPSGDPVAAGSTDERFLNAHNLYRCMHDVPLMTWDAGIAARAKEWADMKGGRMEHSSSSFRKAGGCAQYGYCGENLAIGTRLTPERGVELWYDEIQLTNGGLVSSFSSGTGHYTQVVWKTSTALGCAVSAQNLQVCMYGPGGNMGGQFDANVNGPKKSESECQGAR